MSLDGGLCAGVGLFYLCNRLWLIPATGGWAQWFLSCYANDIGAGLAIVAWADLLLAWARLPSLRRWVYLIPFLLACSLVWEVLAPLWKAGAVSDPWDWLAYQVGGFLFWLVAGRRHRPS